MFEGQQVIQAIFRQTSERKRPKVANIDFDREGNFHFVGTPDTYEGVRNLLALHGVRPDVDPLEAATIIPVNPATGESVGEAGTGKVKPPSENYNDLDNMDEIRALKAQKQNGVADTAATAAGSGEAPVQHAGADSAAERDLLNGSAANPAPDSATRAASGGIDQLRPQTAAPESASVVVQQDDDDADFSFT